MEEEGKKTSEEVIGEENLQPEEEETPIIPSGPDPDPEPEPMPQSFAPPGRKRNWKKLIYLLGVVLIILVLFNLFKLVVGSGKSTPKPTPTPSLKATPTPSPSETPTPTPASLNRSDLTVAVENGSGESGVAGKAKDFLKNLGYDVVSTDNADNFNYKDVTVKVKVDEKKYLPLLIKDLSAQYTIGGSSSDLDSSSSAQALVIIGK